MKTNLFFPLSILSLTASAADIRPNIVLILCDDMGFSDLSCYGGEVRTPNIDLLAANGIRFSQFKNAGRSCPSRAALITGRHQHEVGMGWMTAVDEHRPGYRGQISEAFPTIAEVLKSNGYATYMSGKWHVTVDGAFGKPNGSYPTERGFDKFYGSLSGGGSYYTPAPIYSNLDSISTLPADYYYTTAITDSAVSFIQQHPEAEPLFMYLAHYAPHRPLQAPAERVKACIKTYEVGYDVLRQQRFERMKKLGFVSRDATLPVHQEEFGGKRPAWNELSDEKRKQWITDMATYAAMIEIMDDGIGQVINTIKEKGMLDNTIFLFMSDNGATNEGGPIAQLQADLSNTPYRNYKQFCFQGGISSPLILSGGNWKEKGIILDEPVHIIDMMPTCLDMVSVNYPKLFNEQKVPRLEGTSILPLVHRKRIKSRDLFFEHQSSCAIISNNWKLVRSSGTTPWQLINLTADPFEEHDLSAAYPQKVKELEAKWNAWAEKKNVFPFEYRGWTNRINHYKSLNAEQTGK